MQRRCIIQEHWSFALNPPAQATIRDLSSMTTAATAATATAAAATAAAAATTTAARVETRQQTMRRGPVIFIM